jgi:hypothetical protein
MNSRELDELNAKIRIRSQSLARLVLRRLSHTVKASVPDARTLHFYKNDYHGFTLERVTGTHNRVIHRLEGSDAKNVVNSFDLFGTDYVSVIDDVTTYAKAAGARLHMLQNRATGAISYSLHLHSDVD